MHYKVYRRNAQGEFVLLAETRYLMDAKQVLENWHAGYIETGGVRVVQKNVT